MTANIRVQNQIGFQAIELNVIFFDNNQHILQCRIVSSNSEKTITFDLPKQVQNAWLFDLFHRHHCLVSAPEGVHFGKTSGKHSDKFLRAANALIGSLECSLLAFFLLPFSSKLKPDKIHVDTGPLVSVAMALNQQLTRRGIWTSNSPKIESFSSYDGIDRLTLDHKNDLFLISASTSGGLKNKIAKRIGNTNTIATIFYLQADQLPVCNSHILCDLNENKKSYYGYSKVETFADLHTCKWCKEGIPFAEFEGDQFLLQKRKTQFINISFHPDTVSKCSLQVDAKMFFALCKSRKLFSVRFTAGDPDGYREVRIDKDVFHKLLIEMPSLHAVSTSALTIVSPVNYVISESFDETGICKFLARSDVNTLDFEKLCSTESLQTLAKIDGGSVLVAFDALISMHEPRKISEILRAIVPNGTINYFAGASVVESSEQFLQLSAALKTGDKGPKTYGFEPGYVVLLRKRYEALTPWQKEQDFLQKLVTTDESNDTTSPKEILDRLAFLKNTGESVDQLFWNSQNGNELKLQNGFVFLNVDNCESQADVYAIVSNLLSTTIQNNRDPKVKYDANVVRKILRDSIYSEALIEPNNFLKFNDAVLRASILRAANSFELNYSRDLSLSSILTSLIMHEISEWKFSRGQCLMEFLIALATKHLRLCTQHLNEITSCINMSIELPCYVKRIAFAISDSTTTSPTPYSA